MFGNESESSLGLSPAGAIFTSISGHSGTLRIAIPRPEIGRKKDVEGPQPFRSKPQRHRYGFLDAPSSGMCGMLALMMYILDGRWW